jgi:hypothetical protein
VSRIEKIRPTTVTSLFSCEQRRLSAEHECCRSSQPIFQFGKDFNTSVDKFVEIAGVIAANFSFLKRLHRFAQKRCKAGCVKRWHPREKKVSRFAAARGILDRRD